MTLFVGLFAAVTVLGWFGLEFARYRRYRASCSLRLRQAGTALAATEG